MPRKQLGGPKHPDNSNSSKTPTQASLAVGLETSPRVEVCGAFRPIHRDMRNPSRGTDGSEGHGRIDFILCIGGAHDGLHHMRVLHCAKPQGPGLWELPTSVIPPEAFSKDIFLVQKANTSKRIFGCPPHRPSKKKPSPAPLARLDAPALCTRSDSQGARPALGSP